MRRFLVPLLLVSTLIAQTPAPPQAKRSQRYAKALGLSDEQRSRLLEIQGRHKDALQAKRDAVGRARESLRNALQDPKAPEADLRKLHAQMTDLRFDLLMELRARREEVRALLTPEQRERAAEWRGRMEERMRLHKGMGLAG